MQRKNMRICCYAFQCMYFVQTNTFTFAEIRRRYGIFVRINFFLLLLLLDLVFYSCGKKNCISAYQKGREKKKRRIQNLCRLGNFFLSLSLSVYVNVLCSVYGCNLCSVFFISILLNLFVVYYSSSFLNTKRIKTS